MYSQCPGYKKVGLTAGFDPNGGGFAQYVRALPWVAERGMVAIPDDISFDEASFIEPVNTCIKAVEKARVAAGETAVVMGLGPIGLLLAMLSKLEGATVIGSDPMPERRAKSLSLGIDLAVDPREGRLAGEIKSRTQGRGADVVLVAVPIPAALTDALNLARPGGRVLLFAQNDPLMKIEFPAAAVGVDEKEILGSYSAAIDRAGEAARLIFTHKLPVTAIDLASFFIGRYGQGAAVGGPSGWGFSKSGDSSLNRSEHSNGRKNGHMTAAILYGSENLKIESVDIPRLAADEALIRVKVALTCGTDLKVWKRGYHARMITPPAVFGHELAGIVETLGSDVNGGLKVGARVVPSNSAPCNVCLFCRKGQSNLCEDLLFNNGAYAEYIRIPGRIVRQNMLVIPEHVSFQDAAMVEPLACVLRGIHETGIQPGDTTVVIGCGPIGLKFIRVFRNRGVKVIALGKRPNQIRAAERFGARAAFIAPDLSDPAKAVRELTEGGRGADSVIEAVGTAQTWEWALQMVRRGGTVNLFGGCPRGTQVAVDPNSLHYSEITIKSTFHHTPRFIREALESVSRGEIRSSDFVNAEIPLTDLPKMFEHMKHRNGEMKVAVIP